MIKAAIVSLSFDDIEFAKDSTLVLMQAAQEKGWELDFIEPHELAIADGKAIAYAHKMRVFDDAQKWYETEERRRVALQDYDVILSRIDPPVNREYVYATQIMEMALRQGVYVTNPPAAIRNFNEKLFATLFPELMPPHLVSSSIAELSDFHKQHGSIVLKPLDGMGGQGVFLLQKEDLNQKSILNNITAEERCFVMAQKFIPAILDGGDGGGDKRVLVFHGEPYPQLLQRMPVKDDFRANMAAGGKYKARDLGDAERKICDKVIPFLKEQRLDLVGLDIIGGYLSEINITCPTGLRQISGGDGLDLGRCFIDKTEEKLKRGGGGAGDGGGGRN